MDMFWLTWSCLGCLNAVLESLSEHLMQSHARKDVNAIVVTGYGGRF